MSNVHVIPGKLRFCPDCLDVFGVAGDDQKPCACDRSAGMAVRWGGGDFPLPFHICLFCGLEIVRSGSRWSTFYCGDCRVAVLIINDRLDQAGCVSLPIGRHSLMHCRWRHARPFAAVPMVRVWARQRMEQYWAAFPGPGDDWVDFTASSRNFHGTDRTDLTELALRLQTVSADSLFDGSKKVHARWDKSTRSG